MKNPESSSAPLGLVSSRNSVNASNLSENNEKTGDEACVSQSRQSMPVKKRDRKGNSIITETKVNVKIEGDDESATLMECEQLADVINVDPQVCDIRYFGS